MTTGLVLDCDTGSDDAVAIMTAALHPELELIALSTANGNVALPNTLRVFSAGIRDSVVIPLDATHSAPLTATDCEEFDEFGTPAGTAASRLIRHRIEEQQDDPAATAVPVHDALCIAYLVRPDVITDSGSYHVDVETGGDRTLGQMIVDTRPWSTAPVTATVAMAASADVYREVLRDALRNDAKAEVSGLR
ncbi:nucleoside hydrolase [Saccharopolyspora sp. NPDC050389]|uniref:nucleoside hydrolase n=1 Tax=Saccharopolyspora sp. NPDC050389 TaxID=3155516 RepID=UPI0033D99EA9